MPTLITVYITGMGRKWQRRCDGKCHNATKPRCRCICGGVNHGVGLDQARANTKEITDEQLIKTERETYAGKGALTIIREQKQLNLF